MRITSGRDNLSVTVYVPYDCANNCKFCTSKEEYSNMSLSEEDVLNTLKKVANSTIKEVVFTGGEPMQNIETLKKMVDIVSNKDVYINTSLLNKDSFNFINFVNTNKSIKGVNISRHKESYVKDCKTLNAIAYDEVINFIKKPVKINIVIDKDTDISKTLKRWSTNKNVLISFRENFNLLTDKDITKNKFLQELATKGEFLGRSHCDVCETFTFKNTHNKFNYHSGFATTSIQIFDTLQINDIIVFPNGEIYYDWDKKNEHIKDVLEHFNISNQPKVSWPYRYINL